MVTSGLAGPCIAFGHSLGGGEATLIQMLGLRRADSPWIILAGKRREVGCRGRGHQAGPDCPAHQHPTLVTCQKRGYEEDHFIPHTILRVVGGRAVLGGYWKAWSASRRNLHGWMEAVGEHERCSGRVIPKRPRPSKPSPRPSAWAPVLYDLPSLPL